MLNEQGPSMNKKLTDIKVISAGLAILYGSSFFIYLKLLATGELQTRTSILALFLGVLCVGSIAALRLKEWGRVVLVVVNGLMGLYLLKPYLILVDIIPISFVFLNFIIFLFYNQKKVIAYFTPQGITAKKRDHWQCILMIDDDETLIKTIRPIFISHGYSVLTAESGEDGLQIARAQRPDLIILDVILPGIKGRDVCKELKSHETTKHIPVVFLTAKNSADDVEAEKAVGAAHHLTKPVDVKALMSVIQEVLK